MEQDDAFMQMAQEHFGSVAVLRAERDRLAKDLEKYKDWLTATTNERNYWKMMHDEKQRRLDAKSA